MKKVFLLIAALAAIAVSCNKSEMDEIDFTNGSDIISAIIESSKTKTTIADDKSVKWSEGDMFSIITATSRNPFTLSSGAGTTAGTFTGTIPTDAVLGVVFPHNEENTISDNTLNVTLADEYTMPESDVPMWGTYNNGTVTFKHLAGVLRFELNDIPADYNTLKITADKAIAGKFKAAIGDNMQLAPADDNTSADNKVIIVKYTASADNNNDRVMFIPLPATTYGSIKLEISKNGENPVELLTWLNRTVECGKIYTAIRTYGDISGGTPNRVEVAGSDADDISSEILNAPASSTIVINNEVDVNDGSTITLPTPATEGSNLNIQFNTAPSTSSTTPLVLSQDGNNSKDNKVKVVMPSGATGLNVNVNMPNTTTTLEGGSYSNVQSSTADNTLIVLGGTTIENLTVLKGNVRLAQGATISSLTLGDDVSITLILENGATQPTGLPTGVTVMSAAEWDLRKAIDNAANSGTVTIEENVEITSPIIIEKQLTISLNGKEITAGVWDEDGDTNSYVFWVKNGGTLTINGTGTIKSSDAYYSMAVWADGGTVNINGGEYYNGGDGCDLIYAKHNGIVNISAGTFKATQNTGTEPGTRNEYSALNLHGTYPGKIIVTGGSFYKFNPAFNVSENPKQNFVAAGYSSVANGDWYEVKEGVYNELALNNAITQDNATAELKADIILSQPVTVTKTGINIKLNGFDITAPSTDVFEVTGSLTIDGDDNSIVSAGTEKENTGSVCAVWAHSSGSVTINGGYYKVGPDKNDLRNDCIYTGWNNDPDGASAGTIIINGGKFEYTGPSSTETDKNGDKFLINCGDRTASTITVNGGSYKNHVPGKELVNPIGNGASINLGTSVKVYKGDSSEEATEAHNGNETIWYNVK
ncbi:MAG: hypothetical protein IJN06_07615 [Bacteroidales bacterium]|nr:hypothetical protein [Bacteroidales bacterium]